MKHVAVPRVRDVAVAVSNRTGVTIQQMQLVALKGGATELKLLFPRIEAWRRSYEIAVYCMRVQYRHSLQDISTNFRHISQSQAARITRKINGQRAKDKKLDQEIMCIDALVNYIVNRRTFLQTAAAYL